MKLGVTGGIGSGKTSVCRVFSALGVPLFSADQEAKRIMDYDNGIISSLNAIAGRNLYLNGTLDRAELAALIFNDNTLLEKVNLLIHPVVIDHFVKWSMEQTSPYVIMEAAILFESGASKYVDKIAVVVASVEERIDRVIQRNSLTREQVLQRMNNQIDDEKRIKLSDYVIHNSENEMIIPAILRIHFELLALTKS
jgi:dephospho-CoA kinase